MCREMKPFHCRWDQMNHNPLPCFICHLSSTQIVYIHFPSPKEFNMFLDVGTFGIFHLIKCFLRMRSLHVHTLSPLVLDGIPSVLRCSSSYYSEFVDIHAIQCY